MKYFQGIMNGFGCANDFAFFIWFVFCFTQAKIEMDRLIASVGQKVTLHEGIKVDSR